MREVYIVATEDAEPLGPEGIGEAFETDEVTVELDEGPGASGCTRRRQTSPSASRRTSHRSAGPRPT